MRRAHVQAAPSGVALLDAARALCPRIEASADEIEHQRRLPDDLVAQLYDAGLFSMLMPASFGGAELDLPSFIRVVEQLARADGSVAWCIGQANGLWSYAAYLEPRVAREVVSAKQQCILANGPGVGNQPGTAMPVDGGHRISGRWTFASGCQHASWLLALCRLHDADGQPCEGDAALRLMLLPIEQARILDTWHVSGLRGTGSHTFEITDLFVPDERTIWVSEDRRQQAGPLYLFSSSGLFGPAFASVAMGLAHTSLQAALELAAGKTPRGLSRTLRDSPTVQASLARAHARLGAARAYLHQAVDAAWQAASRRTLTLDQRAEVRAAATHAIHEAAAVVDSAYELAGSNAIFADAPFERRFRDVHAVTQQVQGRASHFESVGRQLLGLDPATSFF